MNFKKPDSVIARPAKQVEAISNMMTEIASTPSASRNDGRLYQFHLEFHPILRAQCRLRFEGDLLMRVERKFKSLQRRDQDQLHFHQREIVADAHMRTFAERIIHMLRSARYIFGCEAFGVK